MERFAYLFPKDASQGGFAGRLFLGNVVLDKPGDSTVEFLLTHVEVGDEGGYFRKMHSFAVVVVPRAQLRKPDPDVQTEE